MWLAIVLSMAVIIFWQIIFPPPTPTKRQPVASVGDTVIREFPAVAGEDTVLAAKISGDPDDTATPVAIEKDLPNVRLTIAETGGVMSSITLKNYRANGDSVSLVSRETSGIGHLALVMEEDDRARLANTRWKSAETDTGVIFTVAPRLPELPEGIFIEKEIRFIDSYGSELEIRVRNNSGKAVNFSTAHLDDKLYEESLAGSLVLHIGPDLGQNFPPAAHADQYFVSGSYEVDGAREIATIERGFWNSIFGLGDPPRDLEWAALENRYFTIAIAPKDFKFDARYQLDSRRRLHLWAILPTFTLESGDHKTFVFKVFSGPKSTVTLGNFYPAFEQLDGMEPTVLPKKLPIARWMVDILAWINRFVGNWGWSIIILTILVRLGLYPLAHYQYKSMGKMQDLKPKIDELQAKYARDKERMQRELMKVYSEAGVNPLGGCLPIVLQMPIMIGLFLALQNSIELRGVPWVLWVTDLSVPDTLIRIGIPVNPLPILMGVTMFIQQKLTPMPTADPAQKQIFMMMPIILTVMFYNFPSGLSLYWVVQNILSIGQQYLMVRRKEPKK